MQEFRPVLGFPRNKGYKFFTRFVMFFQFNAKNGWERGGETECEFAFEYEIRIGSQQARNEGRRNVCKFIGTFWLIVDLGCVFRLPCAALILCSCIVMGKRSECVGTKTQKLCKYSHLRGSFGCSLSIYTKQVVAAILLLFSSSSSSFRCFLF